MTPVGGTDGNTTPDEVDRRLRDDIAVTRARMGGTLEQLHSKLNPTVLKEQAIDQFHELKQTITTELRDAKDSMKSEVKAELAEAKAAMREATIGKVEKMVHDVENTAKDTGNSIVDTIRANPLPAALTGIGLAWLFMSSRGTRRVTRYDDERIRVREMSTDRGVWTDRTDRGDSFVESAKMKADDLAGAARGKADDIAGAVKEKADDIAGAVKEKASDLAHGASDLKERAGARLGAAGHAIEDKATYLARQAKSRSIALEGDAERRYSDNPFIFGAAMVVAGAAVGMALPITSKENQWLGGVRDEFLGKAKEYAEDTIDRAGEAAQRATEQVATKATQNL